MSDGAFLFLLIGAAVVAMSVRKKKKPDVIYIETWEIVGAPRDRTPRWLKNLAIIIGVLLFLWAMGQNS